MYMLAFRVGISQVKEPGMYPLLNSTDAKASDQDSSKYGFKERWFRFWNADKVLYKRAQDDTKCEKFVGKVVAMMNPFSPREVIYRRVIASEGDWVQRLDDNGIINIPKNHVWVECEC